MFFTMPFTMVPSCKVSIRALRSSPKVASNTARRDTTTLLRLRSSLMTLNSTSLPSNCEVSLMGRTSNKEPGKKARMLFTITVKPPFTLPLITPDRISPSSMASSRVIQSAARLAFSRESLVSPKPFSTDSMVTVTKSPTLTSSSPKGFLNSAMSISDSDFKPALTMTNLSVMSTTSAVITSP